MTLLCTVEEVRAAERRAIAEGVSEAELMHRAGTRFAELILTESRRSTGHAVVLVGPGNNGGDGLVAAAHLIEHGWSCSIFGWNRSEIGNAPISRESADRFVWITEHADLTSACRAAHVVIDAVFGIGGRAELPLAVAQSFRAAHEARVQANVPLWALDVPSGIDADSGDASDDAFRADVTAVLGLPKIGVYRNPALQFAGSLRLIDIGLKAPNAPVDRPEVVTESDVRQALVRRPRDAHKSSVGWLIVIGGAPNYYGAPQLAAEAAARAGAGLVCLAVPRSLVPPIASSLPEVTFLPLPENELGGAGSERAGLVKETLPRYRAALIGPGLGRDDPVDDFLANLLGIRSVPRTIGFSMRVPEANAAPFTMRAVIDADGLNWLSARPGWPEHLRQAELILTPHPGELARLMHKSVEEIVVDPWTMAREAARRFGQIVVLKQAHAVAAAPDGRLALSPQAQPALATAGTGDVLGGIIAGLLAQGIEPFSAACSGLVIGSMAADEAVKRMGTLSLVASDVIEALPPVLRSLYDTLW